MDLLIQELEWGRRSNMKNDEKLNNTFYYKNDKHEEVSVELSKDDFVLSQADKSIHDVKFESKPTTFAKDALKRFAKNKSSVVGGIILGVLAILAFAVPIIDQNDVTIDHPQEIRLEPKLFAGGTGFWDGCRFYDRIAYDYETNLPDPQTFLQASAVLDLKVNEIEFANTTNNYGKGGFVRFSNSKASAEGKADTNLYCYTIPSINLNYDYTFTYTISDEVTNDGYENGTYAIYMDYLDDEGNITPIILKDYSKDYGSNLTVDVNTALKASFPTKNTYSKVRFGFKLKYSTQSAQQILIKEASISSTNTDEAVMKVLAERSFSDANAMGLVQKEDEKGNKNTGYWACTGNKYFYRVQIAYCSFKYDTYEAAYGDRVYTIGKSIMEKYVANGWCEYSFSSGVESFKRLSDKCPVVEVISQVTSGAPVTTTELSCVVTFYKYLGYDTAPIFLMGTDSSGHDMLKFVFDGLKTSLLLGIITSVICFSFGLVWGAVSGYFGGNVDIAMERFVEILGGMPWIVMMTLAIILMGQSFVTFAIALCLTGWMGTAGTTRTQFYRFKGREYVLASRTLGASDWRLIFKHILPNSLGTITTGAVLMIPGVIFSEATISYLGLGLKGMSSLGVILSENQQYLNTYPYLLVFPSIIIALMMISFNLFGNGLRDAMNPSLKGSE